jgi:hypothetical protein
MRHLRWVKQQDFCLRLGLLKAVVAGMHAGGFGRVRERIVKRFADCMFSAAAPALAEAAEAVLGDAPEEPLTQSDALLLTAGCVSWGQPIKKQTAYKAVEWAQTAGFLASGYRLSERGELWLTLIDQEGAARFFAGDEVAWNPYRLSVAERAFLCYHLGESDELLWQLAFDAGEYPVGHVLEARDTYKLTLAGMRKVLDRAGDRIPLPELPRLRTARDLAATIAAEIDPSNAEVPVSRKRIPPNCRPGRGRAEGKRKTCKNADHQAIPRFEQLVDLGLMSKHIAPGLTGVAARKSRAAWRYKVTPALPALRGVLGEHGLDNPNWIWSKFSDAFAGAAHGGAVSPRHATVIESLTLFMEAYDRIHRPVGHTPFEPVALLAAAVGMERGLIVEIKAIHDVMLALKSSSSLNDQIAFAAGNDVDRMFVMVKKGFLPAYERILLQQQVSLADSRTAATDGPPHHL